MSGAAAPLRGPARIAIVIPAYNEAPVIEGVLDRLMPLGHHLIVVDDGSRDSTATRATRPGVVVVSHPINRGQGAALQTGITVALRLGADVIVTFDADGQHDPADIPALVAPILAGECDVVLGSRFRGRAERIPLARRLLLRAAVWFTWLTANLRVTDAHNGVRAFSRSAAERIRITMDGMAHASEILEEIAAHRLRWREVPVTVRYSEYSLAKGQRSSDSFRIAAQVLIEKLHR
jgi:glycosyltransferase involved in cell wall biosynthesis